MSRTRREFLDSVTRGMLAATVGPALIADLGYGAAPAAEEAKPLEFGSLEPLVCLLQETAGDKLLPMLVERLQNGTELRQLVSAAALANARTFGGEDYIGFHTLMALAPAHAMSRELPMERRALPVLKVLVRNSNRIRENGGRAREVLRQVAPAAPPTDRPGGEAVRDAVRRKDLRTAEANFASLAQGTPSDAFNDLLFMVEDNTEVHRVVLAYRAWDMLDILGPDKAHTLLRQSIHYCWQSEKHPHSAKEDEPRTVLPKMLDQFKLMGKPAGMRAADDKWLDEMVGTLFTATPAQAAEAVAAALAEGMRADALGEAISLTANQLALRDTGRPKGQTAPNKPVGSCHGDSIGVHASDSANAWRNIARVANRRHQVAALILGGYQVALDRVNRGGDFQKWQPWPLAEHTEKIQATDGPGLLKEAEAAIRDKDQARAAAAIDRYSRLGLPERPVFDLMLRYAVSEDGALHAEKYYRTVSEEFANSRPAFRWRHPIALARVTASAYGQPAPGYAEACKLLKV